MQFTNKKWMNYLLIFSFVLFIFSCNNKEADPSNDQDAIEQPSDEELDNDVEIEEGKVFNLKYFKTSIEQIIFDPVERKRMYMTHSFDEENILHESYWNFSFIESFGEKVMIMQHSRDTNDVIISSTIDMDGIPFTFEYEYDEQGLISEMIESSLGFTVNRYSFEYNEKDQLIKKQNITNDISYTFTYNSEGRIISLSEEDLGANPTTYTYSYDVQGNLIKEESNKGFKMEYKYDGQGRIIESFGGLDTETLEEYEYQSNQLTIKVYPPESNGMTYIRRDQVFEGNIANLTYSIIYFNDFAVKSLMSSPLRVDEVQYFTNNNFNLTLVGNSKIDARYDGIIGFKKQESIYNAKGEKIYVITYSENRQATYYKGDGITQISEEDITEIWVLQLINF